MKYVNKLGRESEARSPLQKHQEIRRGPFLLTRALFPVVFNIYGGKSLKSKNSLQKGRLKQDYGIIYI